MRLAWILIGLTSALLAGPLHAADTAKAAVAEDKAEVLEEKVVENAPPPKKSEKLTPGEAQAVDPAGQAPLDDSITCLARTIYWEAKGADAEDMSAIGIARTPATRLSYALQLCCLRYPGRHLRAGELLMLNPDHADSMDGRYFGPLPASTVLGRATPILTRNTPDAPLTWR